MGSTESLPTPMMKAEHRFFFTANPRSCPLPLNLEATVTRGEADLPHGRGTTTRALRRLVAVTAEASIVFNCGVLT
jgi:hypothetical protein